MDKVAVILKGQGSGASQSERIKMVEQLVKDGGRYKPGKGDKNRQMTNPRSLDGDDRELP